MHAKYFSTWRSYLKALVAPFCLETNPYTGFRIVPSRCVPTGVRLNECTLWETLAISRTPLSEALRVLAGEGLIDIVPTFRW
ncbi:GntR family transcriptional regulator [Paraburkholderia sp. RP-4-7]|uniref:GntR family transcriptional regulator n=1 Tax=Paraburkholderia polaris TaxID=2728848 RepID=A0A848IQU8_9BURK|nr:GntR family transcriptional regulator [Paraburkholderia polaris]